MPAHTGGGHNCILNHCEDTKGAISNMVPRIFLITALMTLCLVVTDALSLSRIENIKLRKVVAGSIVGDQIVSKQLFKSPSTVVFAVRRPG